MNSIRLWCSLIVGLAVSGATYSICAGIAAWMFTVTITYDWSKRL